VISLIEQLDAYQKPLYPAESYHGIDVGALSHENVLFAVARSEQGHAVACGAIVLERDYGEVKRMFTTPGFRGRGIGGRLLTFLESEARARGCRQLMLETGIRQPEAIALYARFGYERCGPFGDYAEDPNSVFMTKGP
jgi:putative acetyltransferase